MKAPAEAGAFASASFSVAGARLAPLEPYDDWSARRSTETPPSGRRVKDRGVDDRLVEAVAPRGVPVVVGEL